MVLSLGTISLLVVYLKGTILGPLLFIIYIKDLPNCLSNAEPRMYADDTHISFASNITDNINTVLNVDLARVEKWLSANKLTLNASKTKFMSIGSRQKLSTFHNPPSLMIDRAPVTHVISTKSLGVHIDQTLSWNAHVENLCKKIASGIRVLKRVRPFVPHETLQSIFTSLVQPHFDYCNSVWPVNFKNFKIVLRVYSLTRTMMPTLITSLKNSDG